MHPNTRKYNEAQALEDQEICDLLAREIDRNLPEAENLERWLAKARDIQWDYRNLIRRKGRLERLK